MSYVAFAVSQEECSQYHVNISSRQLDHS